MYYGPLLLLDSTAVHARDAPPLRPSSLCRSNRCVRIVLAAVSIKSLISEPFDCATRSGPLPLNLAGDYGPLTLTRDNRKVRRSSRAGIELIESCCTRRATSRSSLRTASIESALLRSYRARNLLLDNEMVVPDV